MPDDVCVFEAKTVADEFVGECIAMRFSVIAPPEAREEVLTKWGLADAKPGQCFALRAIRVFDEDGEAGVDLVFVKIPAPIPLGAFDVADLYEDEPEEESPDETP